jgi:hypothetical protein
VRGEKIDKKQGFFYLWNFVLGTVRGYKHTTISQGRSVFCLFFHHMNLNSDDFVVNDLKLMSWERCYSILN